MLSHNVLTLLSYFNPLMPEPFLRKQLFLRKKFYYRCLIQLNKLVLDEFILKSTLAKQNLLFYENSQHLYCNKTIKLAVRKTRTYVRPRHQRVALASLGFF